MEKLEIWGSCFVYVRLFKVLGMKMRLRINKREIGNIFYVGFLCISVKVYMNLRVEKYKIF